MEPLPALQGLSLQVTDACNLACSYCYFKNKEPLAISYDAIDCSLNMLEQYSDSSQANWHINLFGGEPTLFPDRIKYICEKATKRAKENEKDISFSITTNGVNFDKKMLQLCKHFKVSTTLSLDGNQSAHNRFRKGHNGHGSYQNILKNIDRLKSAPNFRVRMTISTKTLPDLSNSIKSFIDLGISRIATSIVAEDDWSEKDIETYGAQWLEVAAFYIREHLSGNKISLSGFEVDETHGVELACRPKRLYGCGAGTTFVFVNVVGDLYPCHRYPGYFDKDSSVRIGSVFNGIDDERRRFYVTANKSTSKKGCSSFINNSPVEVKCSSCLIKSVCGGSCMAINHNATGDPTLPPSIIGRIEGIMLSVADETHNYLRFWNRYNRSHQHIHREISK